jgi:FtsH-binding integral membrane protein
MNDIARLKYLRIALVLVGIIFIFGIYLLMIVWPSGWTWHTGHSDYPLMIVGVYATLGVFLLRAAPNPLDHLSLIWFTVWSSVVHASIMALQSFEMPQNHGHLFGDVPALFIIAAVLGFLTPRREALRRSGATA